MTTFGLVHGAAHGAWCWDRITPLLEAAGHRAIAVDLPCEDPTAGAIAYADVVVRALGGADDVVLVGHSLGGLTIPLVATKRPVRHLVYLAALMPRLGMIPFGDDPDAPPMMEPGFETVEHEDGTFSVTAATAAAFFYGRCTSADTAWASARLRRQSRSPHREVCPLERWPDVERTYILGAADRCVLPSYARWLARGRAGVEPIVLDADHSPFLSAPRALAQSLLAVA